MGKISLVKLSLIILLFHLGCSGFQGLTGNNGSAAGDNIFFHDTANGSLGFRDIPGITEDEIRAIEYLQRQKTNFVYGAVPSTEAFIQFGSLRGFTSLLCDWLTELFDISFTPALYEWDELISGLESGDIDFTGELTVSDERENIYLMTGPITTRSIKYVRLEGSQPLQNIVVTRTPRYAFLNDSITGDFVDRFTQYNFETFFVDTYEEAHALLISGHIDAFFADNSMEAVFDTFHDITVGDFIPVIGMPVSLSTQNRDLWPIISAVQKALDNGADDYLKELYRLGNQEHRRHRLYVMLDEEELEFLQSNTVIPFAAEYFNYPVSFYNRHDRQWQGIYFDILEELSDLTGLKFELVNDETDDFPVLLDMLERGEAHLISELLQSEARMGRFRWLSTPSITNNYALLSKTETPNVSVNEVLNMRVGIQAATAYADMFHAWFPLHPNVIEYEGSRDALEALGDDKVDLVMSSQIHLLALTNYYELSGYKANIIFVHAAESYIGFNIEQAVLCSIIDKAFSLIDTNGIASRWASITFDYQTRLLESQRPWLIGAIVLSLLVISLMFVLFLRSRSTGKQLNVLVKKRTAELEIATEAAKAASRSKSSFLANMSHEIRTPMNTIMGVTEIMLQGDTLTEDLEDKLGKIHNSSDMLMGIINDILDFSKIEAGKLDILPSEYFVASLINDSIHLNMMRIGDKPIQFVVKIDENVPAKLIGDELRIKQIFNNLLSNAFKYTDAGNVTFSVKFNNPNLIVGVRDTGRGMTREQIDKLFEEYSRFDEEANHKIEGTGLGLSITKQLITLMNGVIKVESVPNSGSLFTLILPQEIVDDEVLGKELVENLEQFRASGMSQKKRGNIVKEPMPYGRVLVVDDVETNLYVAEGLMRPYMLNIETVTSGQSAINKINNGEVYDIIFMDHMMPEMNGIEAVNNIRDLGYKEPIVALTANAVTGQADLFFQNGFDDFISKPIDLRQLNAVLNKLIRDKQSPDVLEAARSQMKKEVSNTFFINTKAINLDGISLELLVGSVAKYLFNGNFIEARDAIEYFINNGQYDKKENNAEILMQNTADLSNYKIEGLDIVNGLNRFEDNSELYIKVLRSYVVSIRSLLGFVQNIDTENLEDYQRAAHSIKGTSLDISAEAIGKKAAELEEAAKQENLDFIKQENEMFLESIYTLIEGIELILEKEDAKNIKPKKDKIDKTSLEELLTHCQEYDMDGVDKVMTEIEKYQYEFDNELSFWLRRNVDVVDFEAIAQKLLGLDPKNN